jgi:hypothetical protein
MTRPSQLICTALLIGAALIGASAAWAQFPRNSEPMVLSGPDVGFKVTGTDLRTGLPSGVWVVRMQGKWVEVTSEPTIRPAK